VLRPTPTIFAYSGTVIVIRLLQSGPAGPATFLVMGMSRVVSCNCRVARIIAEGEVQARAILGLHGVVVLNRGDRKRRGIVSRRDDLNRCPSCRFPLGNEKAAAARKALAALVDHAKSSELPSNWYEDVDVNKFLLAHTVLRRRKFGAPQKRNPAPGERFQIGIRVTSELKRRLDEAAERSGRSQSQEVELRLERSFDREDLLGEVLSLAYGKEAAALLMALGLIMGESSDLREGIEASTVLLEKAVGTPSSTGNIRARCLAVAMVEALTGEGPDNLFTPSVARIRDILGPTARKMQENFRKERELAESLKSVPPDHPWLQTDASKATPKRTRRAG
jgi:hypothetical protein